MIVSSNIPASIPQSADGEDIRNRTRDILRIAATDTTQNILLDGYVASAVRYLESATAIKFVSGTVTETHDILMDGDELTAIRGPVTATAKFGRFTGAQGQTASEYFAPRAGGWKVLMMQANDREGYLVEYTAGLTTISDDIKQGIAQCAAGLYESKGQGYRNTLRHLNRVYIA